MKSYRSVVSIVVKQLTVGGKTTGTFKIRKGSNRWLTNSPQHHLIVASGSKNLELHCHLLAFCVFGEAISNFFESFLFVRIASCTWDNDQNQWKGNAPVYDTQIAAT